MADTVKECVEEEISSGSSFKEDDLSEKAVEDVLARLGAKRSINPKEIVYIKAMVQRAKEDELSLYR